MLIAFDTNVRATPNQGPEGDENLQKNCRWIRFSVGCNCPSDLACQPLERSTFKRARPWHLFASGACAIYSILAHSALCKRLDATTQVDPVTVLHVCRRFFEKSMQFGDYVFSG